MSYDITIGNAELDADWTSEDGPVARWYVAPRAEPTAPSFPNDTMTGNGNCRSPGYSQWANFCRATGLFRLFYGIDAADDDGYRHEGGVLSHHPGIVPLTPEMHATVRAALDAWRASHPDAIPGWDFDEMWHAKSAQDDGVRGRDGDLARLLWMDWWMEWALRECERPAIANR